MLLERFHQPHPLHPENFPDNNMPIGTNLYKPSHTIPETVPYPHLTRNAFLSIKTLFPHKMLQKKTESFQNQLENLSASSISCYFYLHQKELITFLLFAMSATMMATATTMVTTCMTFAMIMMVTLNIRIVC